MVSRGMNVAWPALWFRMYWGERLGHGFKKKNTLEAYLYAVNSSFLCVNDHSIYVTPKDDGDSGFIFSLRRLAQVYNSASDT